jgi:hypothetical protein
MYIIYIIFSYNSPFHSCSSRRVRLVVMPTNYYRTDELSFRPQEVLIMNELCRMEERRRRRRRVIQKRTTRVNYIYLICIYIYIHLCVLYRANSVNVLNVKLPEYVFVQSAGDAKITQSRYYNNAREFFELNYYIIVVVITFYYV